MAVIWGLDLKEMQWGKFKSNYMFKNRDYHLRRTKFVVYQIAMICTVVSESLGTAALSDYVDQQKSVEGITGVKIHNNNFVGIASYNIFVGIYVATIFGAAFFFDLFWPERQESRAVKLAWRICSVLACMFTLSCAIAYTYIVATKSAYLSGSNLTQAVREAARFKNGDATLVYKENKRALASVVFLWVGTVATFVSTFIMWRSLAYIDAHGPFSTHARTKSNITKPVDEEKAIDGEESLVDKSTVPTPAHSQPAHTTAV